MRRHISLALIGLVSPICMAQPELSLRVTNSSGPFQVGDVVQVALAMSDLGGDEAAGHQTFLEFDEAELTFLHGEYTDVPFGLPILPIGAVGGTIDLASGINVFGGQPPSAADADLAVLWFEAVEAGCIESLQFRVHQPPTALVDDVGSPLPGLVVSGLPGTCGPGCPADFNMDLLLNTADVLAFLNAFVAMDYRTDLALPYGVINTADVLAYLNIFTAGCP